MRQGLKRLRRRVSATPQRVVRFISANHAPSAVADCQVLGELGVEEGPDLAPGVHGLLLAISRSVVVLETVAGAIIAVELVLFAGGLEGILVDVDLLRRRVLVVVAKEAQQGAGEAGRQVDGRDRARRREVFRLHDDTTAPELDSSVVTRVAAGDEEGVATSRAGARD